MNEAHEKTRIRQLEDAAAHWEHKYANARQYNRNLEERGQKLEAALRDTLSGNYPTPARYDEIRALVATAETPVCKHGNGGNCPECATIRAARKRLAMNRGVKP